MGSLNILVVETFVGDRSGANFFLRDICQELKGLGHQLVIATTVAPTLPVYHGCPTVFLYDEKKIPPILSQCNLILTHHFGTGDCVRDVNLRYRKPVVYLCNFFGQPETGFERTNPKRPQVSAEGILTISDHMNDLLREYLYLHQKIDLTYQFHRIRPHITPDKYKFLSAWTPERPRGKYVTCINCCKFKGTDFFYDIVRNMPEVQFLGVRSYYGDKWPSLFPNLTWMDFTENVQSIYKDTWLLIVPSEYESWSRVGQEAVMNGIPVLYNAPYRSQKHFSTTEGITECVGAGGVPLPKDDTQAWVRKIGELQEDDGVYAELSRKAEEHSRTLVDPNVVPKLETFLRTVAATPFQARAADPPPMPAPASRAQSLAMPPPASRAQSIAMPSQQPLPHAMMNIRRGRQAIQQAQPQQQQTQPQMQQMPQAPPIQNDRGRREPSPQVRRNTKPILPARSM